MLTAYIKSMNYVFDDVPYEDLFSFKEWVSGGSGWLFLTSRETYIQRLSRFLPQ
ncbi:type IV secretion system DNA-binding domain-containing protein [Aeromonas hydrophila]|uniref:Type IV secretion system DNA-binding domain-containing protein n=1 Tax=Aeromonas hydrophila TaxID=644 RepID=A0A926FP94_AERHY|nr:type IV secretion system DNA-binding domain-containing protein [Aeromonas hydrophila]